MQSAIIIKRVLDIVLTALLLLLMAMQMTNQLMHEWIGIVMFVLVILHHILNRKYYTAIFKGKYTPLRIFQLIVNSLLMLTFVCTPLSGMMMSRYATPFMNGFLSSMVVRQMHLALSHWSFVLMGIHIGLHFGIVAAKLKKRLLRTMLTIVMCGISVCGFLIFVKASYFDYMFLRIQFAFFDYTKPWWLILIENFIMLLAWAFSAYLIGSLIKYTDKTKRRNLK